MTLTRELSDVYVESSAEYASMMNMMPPPPPTNHTVFVDGASVGADSAADPDRDAGLPTGGSVRSGAS